MLEGNFVNKSIFEKLTSFNSLSRNQVELPKVKLTKADSGKEVLIDSNQTTTKTRYDLRSPARAKLSKAMPSSDRTASPKRLNLKLTTTPKSNRKLFGEQLCSKGKHF